MKIGNYTFSLKNLKYIESRSDETNCFGATLYVNGKRFADCGNSGQGGPTDVHIFPECRELGKEIEAFLKTQPKIKAEYIEGLEMECDLEYIVDELVVRTFEERELQKRKNKTKKCLVFLGPKDKSAYRIVKWETPIEAVLMSQGGPEAIKKVIAEKMAEGYTLLNENIPAKLLPNS